MRIPWCEPRTSGRCRQQMRLVWLVFGACFQIGVWTSKHPVREDRRVVAPANDAGPSGRSCWSCGHVANWKTDSPHDVLRVGSQYKPPERRILRGLPRSHLPAAHLKSFIPGVPLAGKRAMETVHRRQAVGGVPTWPQPFPPTHPGGVRNEAKGSGREITLCDDSAVLQVRFWKATKWNHQCLHSLQARSAACGKQEHRRTVPTFWRGFPLSAWLRLVLGGDSHALHAVQPFRRSA